MSGDAGRIEDTTISNNITVDRPGYTSARSAMLLSVSEDATFDVVDSLIEGNVSKFSGGASVSASYGAVIRLTGVTVQGNSAERDGGGLSMGSYYNGHVILERSTITGNFARFTGGGIDVRSYN